MRCRAVHLNEVGRIAVLAGLFCAIMAVCFFVTARSAQSQPGVDSIDLTQREQALLKRAVNQSIENLRRYYARKEYDKVLEECKNLEKLDPSNNIAVYYRSIAKMGQTQKPFTVDLRQPSGEATVTSPTTRAIAFPRVVPPPSLAVAAPPVETPHAGVAPGVAEPVHPPEDQPEVLVQRGELRAARQEAKATKRGRIHELLAQPSTRYVIVGVGAFLSFFIVFQIIRSRRKTRLVIEAARAEVVSRAETATTELPSGPPVLEERVDEKAEAPSPVAEELEHTGLYTDMPGITDRADQEEIKRAEPETTEETVSAVPEVEAVDISEATERDRLVSAIEGIPTGAEPVQEEDIGEVTLGAEEKSAVQPSALFSDEDIRPESEKAEVGAPEKKEQVEPEPSVSLGEEDEDLGQPDGSLKLDEFLFEQSGKPPDAPPVPKPDDSTVEEWKRKAYDEDFEKMMFTPAAEDATSIGKRISEDDTLAAPPGKEQQPSPTDEPLKASEAKAAEPPPPPQQEAPPAPSPDDEETKVLLEHETKILHPSDDEGPVKEPGESERDARAEASSPGDEDRGSTKTSARARQDELEISDDLIVTPEEQELPHPADGVESQGQQAEVFGKLDLESMREVESEAEDKAGAGASSKIMEERSEALFRDQYKKARDAFAQKDWQKAIHYFSVAVALRPNDKHVKENLRIARENRKKKEDKK